MKNLIARGVKKELGAETLEHFYARLRPVGIRGFA